MRLTLSALGVFAGLVAEVAACTRTVDGTVLVLGRTTAEAEMAAAGLKGYGIAYETVAVPQTGFQLPQLNSSAELGNYGGIVMLSEVSYQYSDGWHSAITTAQFDTIYTYQVDFGVRMVRLDVFPTAEFGKSASMWLGEGGGILGRFIYFSSADSLTVKQARSWRAAMGAAARESISLY